MTTAQRTTAHRVPPHNIEAEESVLGAMLLSEGSISDVLERLLPDDFYKPAHRHVYEAIISLFGRGEAVDAVTVAEELRRNGTLSDVGGKPYLIHLVSSVPAASNATYYGRIVEETSLLRRMIDATQQAAAMAFESSDDVDHIVDQVEQMIFSVAEKRMGDRFSHIRDLLHEHLERVEALQLRGSGITGVPTGFMDLDNLTSGLQASNLIIVAARPSFGKTSFALNIAQQAATDHGVPVAIFSLEMSKMELVQRLVCAEALVDVHKLRTGNLTDQDWSRLATGVGRLADAPVYIDDTEAVTVLEIRAKARRLKQKSDLGLVIVDYLQLMSGPRRSENRQQEISEISRSLKILARELDVPVIAVSQLSRAVEARQDKRPMLADLRECVTGDTLVCLADGRRVPIAELEGTEPFVLAMSKEGRVVEARADKVWRVGERRVRELRLASGRTVRATADHRFFGARGWVRLGDLSNGDRVAIARSTPEPAKTEPWPEHEGQLTPNGSDQTVDWFAPSRADAKGAVLLADDGLRRAATDDLFWDRVVGIEEAGTEDVYDLTVPGPASWLADGIVTHNSGAIEQDADLVMFIYRDEVYNQDSADKGTAEIILAKHRNGPVGRLKLTFLENYTKFASYSGV